MISDIRLVDMIDSIRASLDKYGLTSCGFTMDVKSTGSKSVNVIIEVRYPRLFSTTFHYIVTSIGPTCSFQKIIDHVDAWAGFMAVRTDILKTGVYGDYNHKQRRVCQN